MDSIGRGWPSGVQLGVRFLDDVIDVNHYPLPQIEAITRGNRKIGLGVMGFADALIRLRHRLRLGGGAARSPTSWARSSRSTRRRRRPSWRASAGRSPTGRDRGGSAPGAPPLRNATTTTIAPTGTISILAGCSGGIEPLYAVSFVRQVLDGERLVDVHPLFVDAARAGGWYSDELMTRVAERGSVRGLDEVPADVQRLFATAYDVAPAWHLKHAGGLSAPRAQRGLQDDQLSAHRRRSRRSRPPIGRPTRSAARA